MRRFVFFDNTVRTQCDALVDRAKFDAEAIAGSFIAAGHRLG
jgi:hypothetical protein